MYFAKRHCTFIKSLHFDADLGRELTITTDLRQTSAGDCFNNGASYSGGLSTTSKHKLEWPPVPIILAATEEASAVDAESKVAASAQRNVQVILAETADCPHPALFRDIRHLLDSHRDQRIPVDRRAIKPCAQKLPEDEEQNTRRDHGTGNLPYIRRVKFRAQVKLGAISSELVLAFNFYLAIGTLKSEDSHPKPSANSSPYFRVDDDERFHPLIGAEFASAFVFYTDAGLS
ncbi:hypothetical protein J6590_049074 [Homalodisca vitripennis]|nr:hypothetical protein J6590_049074 [Homalodisca vitripennis]